MAITRRSLLLSSASALLLPKALSAESSLKATPQEALGPFSPMRIPRDHDVDLTQMKGRKTRALGQLIDLKGRVLNVRGEPIVGAKIVLWQANAVGRYSHPIDDNPAPLDPNFFGIAAFKTNAEGRFELRTIKPGSYPAAAGIRTPHLHFDIESKRSRLVTQMYFPDEPLNQTDPLRSSLAARKIDAARVTCQRVDGANPEVTYYAWDLVMRA